MIGESRPCKKSESRLVQKSPRQFAKGVSGTNRVTVIGDITVLFYSIVRYGVVQFFCQF